MKDRKRWTSPLLVLVFSFFLLLITSWGWQLSGTDDPRVAGIAREMAITQRYWVPRLNGEPFLEYPPLGYYPIALSLWLVGRPADFFAVLPMAFLGAGTALLTFLIAKRLGGERIGLTAGLILPTINGFFSLHKHCLVDPTLLFFIALSLYGFVAGTAVPGGCFRWIAIFYLGMSGGFLSKGIIGVGIPAGVAVLYLILKKDRRAIRNLRLGWGILLFILPILLWGGGVAWFESPDYLNEVIRQSLWRFLSPSADHAKPFYFYMIPTLVKLLPWTFLPLFLLLARYRSKRLDCFQGDLSRFAAAWFVTVFVALSVSSAKRAVYLAPIYPAFALLAALAWDCLRNGWPRIRRHEIYGIAGVYLLFIAVHFVALLPSHRSESFGPLFEVEARERNGGPVYLFQPDETLRGAAFFYLGKESPVLKRGESFPEEFGKAPGTIVIENVVSTVNNPSATDLENLGFHLRFQKGEHRRYQVYSKEH